MKLISSAVALVAFVFITDALVIEKRAQKVVSFPIIKRMRSTTIAPPLKRGGMPGDYQLPDINHDVLYLIPITVGTPPQAILAQLDTGSPNLVLETTGDNLCHNQLAPNPCSNYGGYTQNLSSTYHYLDSSFKIVYGDNSGCTGDGATDVANIGGADITGLYLGLQVQTTITENVCGVLFTEDERNDDTTGHTNIVLQLRNQNFIASRAYSLWTNSDSSAGGSVLFGGIDTAKYYCSLMPQQLLPDPSTSPPRVTDFDIALTSISVTDGTTTTLISTATFTVNMDSGTTFALLPPSTAQAIWDFVGAIPYSNNPNLAYLPCSQASSGIFVKLTFTAVTINVPIAQLMPFSGDSSGNCLFAVQKSTEGGILGDVILSSIYVVFDLDNKQLQIAQAVQDTLASNILEIGSGPNAVPKLPGVQAASCATSTTKTTSIATTSQSTTTPLINTQTSKISATSITGMATTSHSTTTPTTTSQAATTSTTSPFTASNPGPYRVGGYAYIGCYTDIRTSRTIDDKMLYGSRNGIPGTTLEGCAAFCTSYGYIYFGVEYYDECYCGNSINAPGAFAPNQNDCSYPCMGNAKEICGGSDRLNLYKML